MAVFSRHEPRTARRHARTRGERVAAAGPEIVGPAYGSPCWAQTPAGTLGLSGQVTVDVAVVGAGLAGLSTAFHLTQFRPSLDVVVLDAVGPAGGASGRGTGLL